MASVNLWFIVAGLIFLGMALAGSYVSRLPLSAAIVYLIIGVILGPHGLALLSPNPFENPHVSQFVAEMAIIVSLFGAGLKLRIPITSKHWFVPLRLASFSMVITIGLVTAIAVYFLHMPLGAGILLGAIIAPTDPVLAADVQVEQPFEYEPLRFSLTGEAGFNDGTALPFVLLGLGLLGLHDLGHTGFAWVFRDLIGKTLGGLAIGAVFGFAVAHVVLYLRREYREALGLDDFLALGLIALSYGAAEFAHVNEFLAVFAAGLALRAAERNRTGKEYPDQAGGINLTPNWREEAATNPDVGPVYMAQSLLHFNEHLENLGEAVVVVFVGSMLSLRTFSVGDLWIAIVLFFVIRPVSTLAGLAGSSIPRSQLLAISWFGIRGIGSAYYLSYAIANGVSGALAAQLTSIVYTTIAASALLHGISVTPLMNRYEKKMHASREDSARDSSQGRKELSGI
jgi:NhaP-type Na+/H+ or K+/H+ antiporter